MKKYFYIFILFIFSCKSGYNPEPVINYKDSKIYDKKKITLNEKCDNAKYEYILTLSCKNRNNDYYYTRDVDVYKIDWDKYNIGDTIK